MRLDRIFALIIVMACVVTAIGNWLLGVPAAIPGAREGVASGAEVALLEVYGPISYSAIGELLGPAPGVDAHRLIQQIQQARADHVKGILLLVNSPGGTTAASQAIYTELMRVRRETQIKIVASFGDVAASGAYYIASAAHEIVANPSSITGSIGVIIQTQNVAPLLDKIGVEPGSIQSGRFKDILSPFREASPAEQEILQGIVAVSYQQFLEAIAAGRNLPLDQLKPLADGRIFTGSQALPLKLVDALGNSQDALTRLAALVGIKGQPRVRNYSRAGFWQALFPELSARLPHLAPGQLSRWPKLPLSLME